MPKQSFNLIWFESNKAGLGKLETKEEITVTTRSDIKKQATILKDFLKQKNSPISQASCYQALAKINGFKDWNTMSAALDNLPLKTIEEPVKNINQSRFLGGSSVEISQMTLLVLAEQGRSGQMDRDGYRLLLLILSKLQENSSVVMIKQHDIQLSLSLTHEQFTSALKQLTDQAHLTYTHEDPDNFIFNLNSYQFWRGSPEKHIDEIKKKSDALLRVFQEIKKNTVQEELSSEDMLEIDDDFF